MELPFKSLLETDYFSVVRCSKLAMQPMVVPLTRELSEHGIPQICLFETLCH